MVAENVGVIVGFASAASSQHEIQVRDLGLSSICTFASASGTGAGAALLEAAIGDRPAGVWLASDNARATAFYRKHGFVEDGVTAIFEPWRLPEKRMVR